MTKFIIVDDGSTDGTGEAIRVSAAGFPGIDVECVRQSNVGLSGSLAERLLSASTPFVALHGAGDISHPERLALQIEHAMSSNAVVVGCKVGDVGDDGRLGEVSRRPRNCSIGGGGPNAVPRPGTHGAALIRTDALRQVGGYRPEFTYAQDADLWLRISAVGSFSSVDQLLYWKWVPSSGTVSSDPTMRFLQALFGELARQCAEDRALGNDDLVERHGRHAPLFLRPSARLSRRLLSLIDQAKNHLDPDVAESLILIASKNGSRHPSKNFATLMMSSTRKLIRQLKRL